MGTDTRKRTQVLHLRVSPEEKAQLQQQAAACSLSVGAYLRNVGLGTQIQSTLDAQAIGELLKINADLGRLGGLLKLWLTDDDKAAQMEIGIRALLHKIEDTQALLRQKILEL